MLHRHADNILARLRHAVGNRRAPVIVDTDDRGAVPLHARHQPLLHCGVMFDAAVTVDMIFGDIEQDANARIEGRREIDLVRRHLDHMNATRRRRLQRQDRGADVTAHLGVVACLAHQVRDQRRGGGLAVGAGDGDERRIGRMALALAAEQFDVADHFDASLLRGDHGPVRLGMGQRHARRQHQRCEIRPGDRPQIRGDETGPRRFRHLRQCVVTGDHLRATRLQRMTACKPRSAEAEHGNRLALEGSDRRHAFTAA